MIVHVYANYYNERDMMPYFLRHYLSFCSHLFLYDHQSDDGTTEMLQGNPNISVIPFDNGGVIDERSYLEIHNEEYKERSRGIADWVISADIDEFIYHPTLTRLLQAYKRSGYGVVRTKGYDMFSEEFPTTSGQIYDEVILGRRNDRIQGKPSIFNPDVDINFGPGRHTCNPGPSARVTSDRTIHLLHCRFMGLSHALARHHIGRERISKFNVAHKLAVYMTEPDQHVIDGFEDYRRLVKPVSILANRLKNLAPAKGAQCES